MTGVYLAPAVSHSRQAFQVAQPFLFFEFGLSLCQPFFDDYVKVLACFPSTARDDAHEGLKKAAAKVLGATWQRCRVHFMRNALAHAPKGQRQMVAALIRTVFAQETEKEAHRQWRVVADQLGSRFPSSLR